MRAILYVRVSSEIQRERASIQSQIEYAADTCRLQGITILETYKDDGVSGTIKVKDRPEGARMLADARAGKFDTVLLFRIDRLARSTSDLLNTIEALADCGVAIKSLTEPFDTSTPTGKFMVSTLGGIAELERANFRDRTKSGMRRRARQGHWLGGIPPFGYRAVDGKLEIDPVQAQIVRDVFSWYLSGQRIRAIALRLNALSIKHPLDWHKPVSRPFYEATISHMLHQRRYTGLWEWGGVTIPIPALVSQDDFDRVQQTLKDNFKFSSRNAKHFYLLRGLIACGVCGKRYVGLGSGRPRWYKHYYRCSSHVSAVGRIPCGAKAVRADLLESAVWNECVSFISDPADVLSELRAVLMSRQWNQQEITSEIAQMTAAIEVKSKERARVISLVRRGLVTDNEAVRELELLQSEVAQLQRQREDLQSSLTSAEDAELRVVHAETLLDVMSERISGADDELKRQITLALVDSITIETINEGGTKRPLAHVRYVFRPLGGGVDYGETALAISSARFAESCPRTSRKSTL